MSYHLTTKYGGTEAVIDDNCGISKFYLIANALTDQLDATFLNQVDDTETMDWDFQYKNYFLTLHYNIFNGVSILPHTIKGMQKENEGVLEVAQFLKKMAY